MRLTLDNAPDNAFVREESPAEQLERGEVLTFSACPFPLPPLDEREFLFRQRIGGLHKNISYNPNQPRVGGFQHHSDRQEHELGRILGDFGAAATQWMATLLPQYAPSWQRDRVSYRSEEEATRRLRLHARNDLLHIDAFPTRPSQGWRILRLFVNIHPSEPRVWMTSDTFGKLLARFGRELGLPHLPGDGWTTKLARLFAPGRQQASPYDQFMLRFHHFLKTNDDFQERAAKRFWHFAPLSAWLLFTDGVSHAEMRGRYALEHSYFIDPATLALPNEAPAELLRRACATADVARAA